MRGGKFAAPLVFLATLSLATAASNALAGVAEMENNLEFGVSGRFVSIDGVADGAIALSLDRYARPRSRVAVSVGVVARYQHIAERDVVEPSLRVGLMLCRESTQTFPFLRGSLGLRREWLGSFSENRHPIGFDLGMKAFLGGRAAMTTAYEFRRVLSDPVKNFNEHAVSVGVSVFF